MALTCRLVCLPGHILRPCQQLVSLQRLSWGLQTVSPCFDSRGCADSRWDTRCLCRAASAPTSLKGLKKKRRLDECCLEQYPEYSRSVIQSWIAQGKVLVNETVVTKAGTAVSDSADIRINAVVPKHVGRGGQKLEAGLEHFQIEVQGKVALDAGISTGGFTDCLLQHGAMQVFGIDVGYGQVAEKVRVDERVVVMERTNLRHLRAADLGCRVQLVTLDLSFISVVKVMPAVCDLLVPGGDLLVLIKPQFEAGKSQVSAGGVVRDARVHREVVQSVTNAIEALGFDSKGVIESPIRGATSGNKEFLAHFERHQTVLHKEDVR